FSNNQQKSQKQADLLLTFSKEPILCSIDSISRLKRSCHMFPTDDLIRTLKKVVDHYRDRRIALATNRRDVYPGVDLCFKPVLESIGADIGIGCLVHQHTHRL